MIRGAKAVRPYRFPLRGRTLKQVGAGAVACGPRTEPLPGRGL